MKLMLPCAALLFLLVVSPGCSKTPTDEQLLKSAIQHQSSDEFDPALSDFQLLVEKYPKSDKIPEALFAMGSIYLNDKKEYAKAESLYTRLTMDYPEHATAQAAAYQRARILAEHLHKPDSAMAAYELFLRRYPGSLPASSAVSELEALRQKRSPGK